MKINLVLADDHHLVLKGLEMLLRAEPDFDVLAVCRDGTGVLRAVRQHQPDILVLDSRISGESGLTVIRALCQEGLPTQAVLLSAPLAERDALDAMRLGVRGILPKELASQLLPHCLRRIQAGGAWLEERDPIAQPPDEIPRPEERCRTPSGLLTRREVELARQVASGLNNRTIGERLHISEGTVKVHLHRIYDKLGIRGRVGLTVYVRDLGLM